MPFYLNEDGEGYFVLEDGTGFLELEDGNPPILVPFIAATTTLYTPTVANDAKARISQAPVEAAVAPDDAMARMSQEPIEVAVAPTDAAARLSQLPIEVAYRNTHETISIVIID